MSAVFFALVFLSFWVWHELYARRKAGLEPSSVAQLFRRLQKKTATDPRQSALGFACSSIVVFGAWEGMIRGMLDRGAGPWLVVCSSVLWGAAFYLRRSPRERGWRVLDLAVVMSAFLITQAAWFSFALSPWFWYRARYLRTT